MRKYIDIVTEGEVVPFPQVNRPTNAMNAIHGGEVHRFAKRPLFFSLDSFTQGYIEAALWTDEDRLAEDGCLEVSYNNLTIDAIERMIKDSQEFQAKNSEFLDQYVEMDRSENLAGHDFWLTRNGHGAGFWDRGLGELGDALTQAAKSFGQCDLYVTDDGAIAIY